MSILESRNFLNEDENKDIKQYNIPRLALTKPEVIPIQKSLAISTALHPLAVFLIWIITFGLALMGIHLFTFKKPDA